MKILREGIKEGDRWYVGLVGTCLSCNAEIQIESTDGNEFFSDTQFMASCPCCKNGRIFITNPNGMQNCCERTAFEADKNGVTIPLTETAT